MPWPEPPDRSRVQLGYSRDRDCTVVAFRDRLGGTAYLRDEEGRLASVATGALASTRRDEVLQRFLDVDDMFRSLE